MLNNVYMRLTVCLIFQSTQIVIRFSRDAYTCTSRVSMLTCVRVYVRACVRRVARRSQWPGQVCG